MAFTRITTIASPVIQTAQITATAVNTKSQQAVIKQQTANDGINSRFTTNGAGMSTSETTGTDGGSGRILRSNMGGDDDDGPPKWPPIFWEEEMFPDIDRIDLEYFETRAPLTQKLFAPGRNMVFLVFHRGDPSQNAPNRKASKKAYDGPDNPNSDYLHEHEVPYASTTEGGALSMRQLTSKT